MSVCAAYNVTRFITYLFFFFFSQPGLFSLVMDLMLALQLQISGNWGLALSMTQQFMNA